MPDRFTARRLTRRALLGRSSIALGVAGALLAACSSSTRKATNQPANASTNAASSSATTAAASAEPRRGGTLTWGQWDINDVIDPANPSGAAADDILTNVLDTLVTIDANEKAYPALATNWTFDNNDQRLTFILRDDVQFHDGSTLDSNAVKRTWQRILDPATKAAGNKALLGPITTIDTPDPKTVVVNFSAPFPLFLLSIWQPYFGILSNKQLDTLKSGDVVTAPIGSGPFKYSGRSADGVVTLDAFPAYAWGPEILANRKAPYLQSIKFRAITENATRTATLESGENLLIDDLPEADFSRLKGDSRYSFLQTPRLSLSIGFFLNVGKPPTDDLAVRQAINWSVDRKGIVDKLFFGVDKIAVGPLAEGVWSHLAELETRYGYDTQKAIQILDTAGWKTGSGGIREKNGQKLSLVLATFRSPWNEIAEALQAQLRAVGMDLQVQQMARGPYLDFVRAYKHNLCASAGTNLDPDILRVEYDSKGLKVNDFPQLIDTQFDGLVEKGTQQAVGSAERMATYADAQRRLMDDLPFVSVLSQVRVEAMAAKVRGLQMGPDGLNARPLTGVWLAS